jgi:hypothetical protein
MVDSPRKRTEQQTSEEWSSFRSGEQPFVDSRVIGVSKQRADAQYESGAERAEAWVGRDRHLSLERRKWEAVLERAGAELQGFSVSDRIGEVLD